MGVTLQNEILETLKRDELIFQSVQLGKEESKANLLSTSVLVLNNAFEKACLSLFSCEKENMALLKDFEILAVPEFLTRLLLP